jgi:spore coat protein U-like protein
MNFGALSPANSTDAIATSTVTIRCSPPGPNPFPYTMTDDDGLYELGPDQNRMRNTGNPAEYLPYSITYTASGTVPRNTDIVFTFTGTVRAVDYQNAWVGSYSDTITVTINP